MNNDPSGFTSFADYLGLNDEAGQSMLQKTMGDYKGASLDSIRQSSDDHYAAAGNLNSDAYDRTGSAVRTGLASYGEFLGGMSDPAKRQALMEKTYGKGAASWLDSALAGASSGSSLAQAKTQLGDLQRSTDDQGVRSGNMRTQAQTNASNDAANAAASKARQEAKSAADEKEKQARAYLGSGFSGAANHVGGGRDAYGNEISGWATREAEWQDRARKDINNDPGHKAALDFNIFGWHPQSKSNDAVNQTPTWADSWGAYSKGKK